MKGFILALIFLFMSGCGTDDYSTPRSSCLTHGADIPCGSIYTEDLLTVHEMATIDALKAYIREKKNLPRNSPFRKIDDGKGSMKDLLRGLSLVKHIYQVNPIFALALSALESGWGTSELARKRYNLWGWDATTDGKRKGRRFKSWTDGFNTVFRRIKVSYLRHTGKYYKACAPPERFPKYVREGGCTIKDCGASLAGMNCKYSYDNNWAKKIRVQMDAITSFINARCRKLIWAPYELPSPDMIPSPLKFSFCYQS